MITLRVFSCCANYKNHNGLNPQKKNYKKTLKLQENFLQTFRLTLFNTILNYKFFH